jgi:hypothetical protein
MLTCAETSEYIFILWPFFRMRKWPGHDSNRLIAQSMKARFLVYERSIDYRALQLAERTLMLSITIAANRNPGSHIS